MAISVTSANEDVEATLLALAVVDDILSVWGLLRVAHRPEVRLSSIPALSLAVRDGVPLQPIGAHAKPQGGLIWVTWTFQRPRHDATKLHGRIDHVDIEWRGGRFVREDLQGPWEFTIQIAGGRPGRHHAKLTRQTGNA
jgi:hypothetical protein